MPRLKEKNRFGHFLVDQRRGDLVQSVKRARVGYTHYPNTNSPKEVGQDGA